MSDLVKAKEIVEKGRNNGIDCPCCGLYVKEWKKSIISIAVASLCKLVSKYKGKYIHLDDFNVQPKDRNFSQLVLWKLIKKAKTDDSTKRASGMWMPTEKGIKFARGEAVLKKYVITLNNKCIGYEGDFIDVKEALNSRFNYSDLMGDNYSENKDADKQMNFEDI